ncbi:MAG: hypothetical protein IAE82_17230 [Opitutaceae bacterium]|nr:hypothetical protein [Opitutaceae bacterium]
MPSPSSRSSQPRRPASLRETDLYAPVRDFLAAQGFTVRAEVHRCDVAATRGEDLVIVELKVALSLELLAQAVRRQRLTDTVYLAVPRPATRAQEERLRAMRPLLRRLELGLLVVDLGAAPASVSVAVQPQPVQRRREIKARRALLQELAARTGDDNAGGSTRRPLVTVYREQALFIAVALHRLGAMAPKRLRELGAGPKTLSILRSDVYGWFERVGHALYALKPAGVEALIRYADVVARLEPRLAKVAPPQPAESLTPGAAAGTSAPGARRAASR